jgi:hypothetical protein
VDRREPAAAEDWAVALAPPAPSQEAGYVRRSDGRYNGDADERRDASDRRAPEAPSPPQEAGDSGPSAEWRHTGGSSGRRRRVTNA